MDWPIMIGLGLQTLAILGGAWRMSLDISRRMVVIETQLRILTEESLKDHARRLDRLEESYFQLAKENK